jgi:hypothetical protein
VSCKSSKNWLWHWFRLMSYTHEHNISGRNACKRVMILPSETFLPLEGDDDIDANSMRTLWL